MPVSDLDKTKKVILHSYEELLKDAVKASLDPVLRMHIVLNSFSEKGYEELFKTEVEKSDVEYAISFSEQLNDELSAEEILLLAKIHAVIRKAESFQDLEKLFDPQYACKTSSAIRLSF